MRIARRPAARLLRGASVLAITAVVGAMLPLAAAGPVAAATPLSPGCEEFNAGYFNEPSTTGVGAWSTWFAGDTITFILRTNRYSVLPETWRLEIGGSQVDQKTLVGSAIQFSYTFADDTYTSFHIYETTGNSSTQYSRAAALTATCKGTTSDILRITTWPTLPGGMVDEPYRAALGASGGTGPYSWLITSGSTPPGITMSAAGVLTGTPTQGGSFPFTVKVTDANGQSVTRGVVIEVEEPYVDEGDLPICHKVDGGDGYELAFTTADIFFGPAAHSEDAGDIVPDVLEMGAGRNWDAEGIATYFNGCDPVFEDLVDTDGDALPNAVDADDDGDGIADVVDEDQDGDGVPNAQETDGPSTTDTDEDGLPNAVDADDDGDGIADVVDEDKDGDGIPNVLDAEDLPAPDQDGDGLPDAIDGDDDGDCLADAEDPDRDGDGLPDASDPDLDNDGIANEQDTDVDGDGQANQLDVDGDGDGKTSIAIERQGSKAPRSTCPLTKVESATRPWIDTDSDGTPNVTDEDDDNDGVPDLKDADADGDGVVDTKDRDANADGIVETRVQALEEPLAIPAIAAGEPVDILEAPATTVAGQRARVEVECTPVTSTRAKDAGDVSVPDASGRCLVVTSKGRLRLFVYEGKATKVTVRVYAPALGRFKPLHQEIVRVVR